ncbi:MAG TPA: hypothetical protein VFW00_12560 [Rhodocyclaceae bacterium]|nr:hypothetical protein [Rhodocyclaceae bacterium]
MILNDSELVFGERRYERRSVSFFDILGWRNHIKVAGNNPRHIARLASLPLLFCRAVTSFSERIEGAQITSFSDNVIVSVPYTTETVFSSLQGIAKVILGAAAMGFFIRGAFTIGDLVHDEHIVFGPALIRAYELESKRAIFPRTILDPELSELMQLKADFIANDSEFSFIQPFNCEFIERAMLGNSVNIEMMEKFESIASFRSVESFAGVTSQMLLDVILARVLAEQASADSADIKDKYSWLLKQISDKL